MSEKLNPYEDPNHEYNSSKYHTGKKCIIRGCDESAGTKWGIYWCQKHNAERLDEITNSLEILCKEIKVRES